MPSMAKRVDHDREVSVAYTDQSEEYYPEDAVRKAKMERLSCVTAGSGRGVRVRRRRSRMIASLRGFGGILRWTAYSQLQIIKAESV